MSSRPDQAVEQVPGVSWFPVSSPGTSRSPCFEKDSPLSLPLPPTASRATLGVSRIGSPAEGAVRAPAEGRGLWSGLCSAGESGSAWRGTGSPGSELLAVGSHRERGSVGKESSQAYTISEQEQRMKRLEKLKRRLEMMNNERDELRGILAHYTDKDLNDRFNFETVMLEMQHDQVMTHLKKMPQEISEALYKCQALTKENQFYCIRYSHLLRESLHMKTQVKNLWNENRQLLRVQIALEECSKETKRLCVEASMKIHDDYTKQQQPSCMFGSLQRSAEGHQDLLVTDEEPESIHFCFV